MEQQMGDHKSTTKTLKSNDTLQRCGGKIQQVASGHLGREAFKLPPWR